MRYLVLLLGLALPGPAVAQSVNLFCADEATQAGRAACLELEADTRLSSLESRISLSTATLQGATASGLAAFERGLTADQGRWRRQFRQQCGPRRPALAHQTCRLNAVLAREQVVAAALSRLPGQTAQIEGEVEVVVPVPGFGGAFPFVTFDIPIAPGLPGPIIVE